MIGSFPSCLGWWYPHFFRGLLFPRPLPDFFPVLAGPFFGVLFLAMLSPPLQQCLDFQDMILRKKT
jgi:hypothetical protein